MKRQEIRSAPRRGQVMILGVLFVALLVGMSALAFDLGYLYVVKTLLTTSVDAAALTGIRKLPDGVAEAEAAARRTFAANFETGALLTTSRSLTQVEITSVSGAQRLNITGQTVAPLFFARWFGMSESTVKAQAQSTRRSRNVVLALDYSDSVRGDLPAIKSAAIEFLSSFDPDLDQVGLVTFSTMAGIDYMPQTNFVTGMTNAINAIQADNWTNSAAGLYWSYRALKDAPDPVAHMKLNSIVFFTDGIANVIPGKFTINPRFGSGCTEAEGVVGFNYDQVLNLDAPAHPVTGSDYLAPDGCTGFVAANDYQAVWYPQGGYLPGGVSIFGLRLRNGAKPSIGRSLRNVAANMQVNMAHAIRNDPDLDITVNAIGFADADAEVLNAVANTDVSVEYDSSKKEGLYVYASDTTELVEAFRSVASSVGRLVK